MAKLKPYAFYISRPLDAGLKKLKKLHGTPEGETIRRALADYLLKNGAMKARKGGRKA